MSRSTAPGLPSGDVGPLEQVPHRPPPEQGSPAPAAMLRPVVIDVAALAERGEVVGRVVGGVVIAMCCSEHDVGRTDRAEILDRRQGRECLPLAITPGTSRRVPPAAIA